MKRVIWLGIIGSLLGVMVAVAAMVMLGLVAMNREYARLAELERSRKIEEQAKLLRQEIQRVADLYASSTTHSLQLAQRIQSVLDTAPARHRDFFVRMIPEALRLQALHRIPASATLGMAAYESRFGESELAVDHHNYFGMKAFHWSGAKVNRPTRDLGQWTTAWFRSYAQFRDGVDGFAMFLVDKPRYSAAFEKRRGSEFVAVLAAAGYCPDADYSLQVASLIERHRLDLLDEEAPTALSASLKGDVPGLGPSSMRSQ